MTRCETGRALAIILTGLVFGGRLATAEPFTVIALPDTQYYSQSYPQIFTNQTQWICNQVTNLNIRFVTHEGDIVQWTSENSGQWLVADAAMSLLDGVVPWGTACGNHDYEAFVGSSDVPGSANEYLNYFGPDRFVGAPWYGGASSNGLSSYQVFTAGKRTFRVMHMEMDWPDPALAWAEAVLAATPDVPTILTTHCYLKPSGRPSKAWSGNPEGRSAQAAWNNFISKHWEIFMVLNGHYLGENTIVSVNEAGFEVYQMFANYQGRTSGGNGWLRILTFDEENSEIQVKTYSPWLDQYETDAGSQFTFSVDFNQRFGITPPEFVGTTEVLSDRFRLSFSAVSGHTYRIWTTMDLLSNDWAMAEWAIDEHGPLGTNSVTAVGETGSAYLDFSDGHRFYRLNWEPPLQPATLAYDAGSDTDGNTTWEELSGTANRSWTLATGTWAVTRTTADPAPSLPGIQAAYEFSGGAVPAGAQSLHYNAFSTGNASIELWFKPDDLTGSGTQVLWETGGDIGSSLR